MLLTGAAGAGKTKVFDAFKEYIKTFSTELGVDFTKETIRYTAMTGAAATEIGGSTLHSEVAIDTSLNDLLTKISKKKEQSVDTLIDLWKSTRMLIIDEISFATYKVIIKLNEKLCVLRENNDEIFGGLHIIFVGDFCQLEPIGKTGNNSPIYATEIRPLWDSMNCMVELTGRWRYENDPLLGEMLYQLRENGLTPEIRNYFNGRVMNPPQDVQVQYATFTNGLRHAVNNKVFTDHLEKYHSKDKSKPIPDNAIMILPSMEWPVSKRQLSLDEMKEIIETNSTSDYENTSKQKRKEFEPILKLFSKSKIVVDENIAVSLGVANGTTGLFRGLKLKEGAKPFPFNFDGYWVNAIAVDNVQSMLVDFTESSFSGTFALEPLKQYFNLPSRLTPTLAPSGSAIKINITQFPVSVNYATTVHKLQGKSRKNLFLLEWAPNTRNWAYVALSRVCSSEGLFLKSKIPDSLEMNPHPMMKAMMEDFRSRIMAPDIDNYDDLYQD